MRFGGVEDDLSNQLRYSIGHLVGERNKVGVETGIVKLYDSMSGL